jgi:TRAP-type C4-dicarboxylate transport system permease small subunit
MSTQRRSSGCPAFLHVEHPMRASFTEIYMNAFERFTRRLSQWFNWIALAGLIVMLGIVAVDIVGAKVFRLPVPGAMDFTSLLGLVVIAFAVAQTQRMGRHITVNFLTLRLPKHIRIIVRGISTFLCIIFFCVVIWRSFMYARDMYVLGDASLTVKIPLAPFAYGLAIAFVPMLLILLIKFYSIMKGVDE